MVVLDGEVEEEALGGHAEAILPVDRLHAEDELALLPGHQRPEVLAGGSLAARRLGVDHATLVEEEDEEVLGVEEVSLVSHLPKIAKTRMFGVGEDSFEVPDASDEEHWWVRGRVAYERWPAVRGSPAVLESHQHYFSRGVERHLRSNHSFTGPVVSWGTVATYLSHHTLFEHIVQRWEHDRDAAFLILQDDTKLRPGWVGRLHELARGLETRWERLLLVWWGLKRPRDCTEHFCVVRPPAGPTDAGPECCGKRFYHGLQVRWGAG